MIVGDGPKCLKRKQKTADILDMSLYTHGLQTVYPQI